MCRQRKGPRGKAASNTGWSGKEIRIGRTQGSGRKIRQTNTLTTIAILSQETNEETQKNNWQKCGHGISEHAERSRDGDRPEMSARQNITHGRTNLLWGPVCPHLIIWHPQFSFSSGAAPLKSGTLSDEIAEFVPVPTRRHLPSSPRESRPTISETSELNQRSSQERSQAGQWETKVCRKL